MLSGDKKKRPPGRRSWLLTAAGAFAAFVTGGSATSAHGQTGNLNDTAGQARPLVVSTTLQVTDIGWDDNVFRVSSGDNPIGDFTATAGPAIQATLLVPRLRVTGRSQVDFIYFKRLSQIRSIDTDNSGQIELLLGRVRPFVSGVWANTRHHRNFEIDLPVRRIDSAVAAGVDFYLSGKTSVGTTVRHTRVDYKGDTTYLATDLAQSLNSTATISGVRLGYSLTPFTTVGVVVEQDSNQFGIANERNSEGFRVMSVIDIRPLALISGHAEVGTRKRTFVDGVGTPRVVVARADLSYTLLGRTRFDIHGERDLSYSYRPDQRDFLQFGGQLAMSHQLAAAWDVVGTVGRFSLMYGLGEPTQPLTSHAERVVYYSAGIGHRFQRTRIGFQLSRQTRTSDFSVGRRYEGTRIGSSVAVRF